MAQEQVSERLRTCLVCGMLMDDVYEFHPYMFCILKKAGRDPWKEFKWCAEQLGMGPMGEKPPLVKMLKDAS